MAIAKRPKHSPSADPSDTERQAQEFILGAGQNGNQPEHQPERQDVGRPSPEAVADTPLGPASDSTSEKARENKKPIMVRVDPEMLKRIDRAARRLGISRSAFIMSSTAEKLERME